MLSKPKYQAAALFLNLFGTILLFLSFQATSSNFKFVSTADGRHAVCVYEKAFVIRDPDAGLHFGAFPCPNLENARPAAIVNAEHPSFIFLGFALNGLGFLLQILGVLSKQNSATQL